MARQEKDLVKCRPLCCFWFAEERWADAFKNVLLLHWWSALVARIPTSAFGRSRLTDSHGASISLCRI